MRGVALMGILPVNIASFAMPYSYSNPTVYGGDNPWNLVTHGIVHIGVEQKAMALFSLLFGASIVLFGNKLANQGRSSALHFVRNGWLLLFGIAHYVLLSDGDILIVYAVCAFVIYFVRNWVPKTLVYIGLVVFFLPVILFVNAAHSVGEMDLSSREALQEVWQPGEAKLEQPLQLLRGGYAEQVAARIGKSAQMSEPSANVVRLAWLTTHIDSASRAIGMMLIGMALYKWGFLTGELPDRVYSSICVAGLVVGYVLACYGLYQHYRHEWLWHHSMFLGRCYNHVATLFVAIAYASVVMIWMRGDVAAKARSSLAAFG